MRIYNNTNSVGIQNTLAVTGTNMTKSLEKLSTGLRINRASDDAAGLSVSEGLRAQIRGSGMAQRNANDGLALLQIAESGTQQITESLQRMRELAVQAANGSYTNTDRGYIQQEYAALASEINRIATATTYNGVQLLSTTSAFSFQISAAASGGSSVIQFNPGASNIGFTNSVNLSTGLNFGGVSLQSTAASAISSIDTILGSVLSMRATIGSTMNRLEATVSNLGDAITNLTDADSRIRDTDFAYETMVFTKNQILTQSAQSMLSQANQLPSGVLNLLK